jgi:hypothetical protein
VSSGSLFQLTNWPKPQTPEDVRRFLGFVGYYRRCIKNFSLVSRPLTDLLPTPNKKHHTFFSDDMSNELYFSLEEFAFIW